jgi:hypothetical protein
MRQVTDWLEKLGVPEYAERFENDIDFTLLPELTDQDLEDWRCLARPPPQDPQSDSGARAHAGRYPGRSCIGSFRSIGKTRRCRDDADRLGRSYRRAPISHGDVLRSGRLHSDFSATRRRGVARLGRRISRRRLRCDYGTGARNHGLRFEGIAKTICKKTAASPLNSGKNHYLQGRNHPSRPTPWKYFTGDERRMLGR